MISLRILIVFCLLLTALGTTSAQTSDQLSMQYNVIKDEKGEHLVISGETKFRTQSIVLRATAVRTSGEQVLSLPALTVTPKTSDLATVIGATFEQKLSFGSGGSLSDDLASLIVEVTAQPVPDGAAGSSPPPVKNRMTVDMGFAKKVRRLLGVEEGSDFTPPEISIGSILELDTAILLKVNSNKAVRVRATAFRSGSATPAATSDEKEIPSNGSTELKLTPLLVNTPYQIKILEISPHPGRNAVERNVVQDLGGGEIRTLQPIPIPSVTFQSGPDIKPINNRSIIIPLTVTNASRVRVTLLTRNEVDSPITVEETVQLISGPTTSPQTVDFKLPLRLTTLDPKTDYQVKVEGLTQFDEVQPGPSILSNKFKGLGPLLAKAVEMEFTSQGIKFKADTNRVRSKLEVKVNTGGTQPFTFASSVTGENPEYLLTYDAIKTALGTQTPDNASLPLAVGVKAEDGSEREQALAVTMKINASEIKPGAKTKVREFLNEVRSDPNITPGSGKSIKVGDIVNTGISLLLRFLVPVP